MWGPRSKQVIRHKEADSVCFDGARRKSDSISRVSGSGSGSCAAHQMKGLFEGWRCRLAGGFAALRSPLSCLHFRRLRETRYIDSQTQKPQRQHPPRCRSSSACRGVRGRGWGGEEAVGVTLKSFLCTTWINWIWQVDDEKRRGGAHNVVS